MPPDPAISSKQSAIEKLNQEAWNFHVTDTPMALELSKQAVELSRHINFRQGLAQGLNILGFCYMRFSKNEEAIPLLEESFRIFNELNDESGQADVYETLGIIRRTQGDLGGAISLLIKSVGWNEEHGRTEMEGTALYQLGVTYKHLGDMENALEYLFKSQEKFISLGHTLYESYSINVIGSIFLEKGEYEKALDYFLKGLPKRQQAGDKWGEAGSLDYIGFTFFKLRDFKQAIDYCTKSLAITRSTGDKKGESNCLYHLAEIYKEYGDQALASQFSKESIGLRKSSGDKKGEAEILLFLADLAAVKNEEACFELISDALIIADQIKAQDLISKIHWRLAEFHKRAGNFSEAIKQMEFHIQLEKELNKNTIDQKMANLEIAKKAEEARIETAMLKERNKELTNLNNEIARQKKELETKNRELEIESALERVRSKTMAMQKSEDLHGAVAMVFEQMTILDIGVMRCGIGIMNRLKRTADLWVTSITTEGTPVQVAGDESFDIHPLLQGAFDAWLRQEDSSYVLRGEDMIRYYEALGATNFHLPKSQLVLSATEDSYQQYYYLATFEAGGLFAFCDYEFPEHVKKIIKRFSDVFNMTYKRFLDIKKAEAHALQAEEDLVKLHTEKKKTDEALTELKATQTQLIQSEKMASLGELTAGIAHEIQNPLNFVNNFSELNTELIDELNEQLAIGNMQSAKEISQNLKENEEKINHHGKRADAIVKGMLQHSRSSSSSKELIDINALAEEYMRLTYHGLRARDKSFKATIKTDFDDSIGQISIVPQDIGRVILNLLNNAFYAVNERLRQAQPDKADVTQSQSKGYEPTVSMSTKKVGDKVEIKVSDNGNGIPQKVLEKIFQPFFTTKPTGQGTGLGLSLSYDIITKGHGGDLKVETKEGEGTTFLIIIPTNSKG